MTPGDGLNSERAHFVMPSVRTELVKNADVEERVCWAHGRTRVRVMTARGTNARRMYHRQ